MEHEMDMNDAIDAAAETATTKDMGEEIADEPEVEAEDTPTDPEVETPDEEPVEAPEEPEDDDLAAKLAEMTHDDVVHTPAGKGLTAEIARLRKENRELKAAKVVEPEETAETGDIDLDGLEDDDLVEARQVRALIRKELQAAMGPVQERLGRTAKTERQQIMATGLAALKADKGVPTGVNTSKIVNDAISALGESRPGLLKELLSEPDPVRAVWEYATARMPEAKAALSKAAKAKADTAAERLAKGQDPDTGDEPAEVDDLVADLNTMLG